MTKSSRTRLNRRIAEANGKTVNPPILQGQPKPLSIEIPGPVAIGIPSGDMWDAEFGVHLATMIGQYKIPTILINAKGCYVHKGRNYCVKVAQAKGCGHILFLDSDMTFPALTLVRLLSHQKDVVGCMYSRRVAPFSNLGTPLDRTTTKVGSNDALVAMAMVPTGVLLIKMTVFDKLKRPYFDFAPSTTGDPDDEVGEDVNFCNKALAAGVELWMDPALSMQIGHVGAAIYRVHDEQKAAAAQIGFAQERIDGVSLTDEKPAVAVAQ